ncbi:MAG: Indole-3-glycerol phosphate synthase [Syntrophorhabdaceae bacterium PtaU1.Bin034]|jgi:indole-3-glycerol phosphate synthase|nr:MAG: Indole-3-glycerol phosphate synthase [Syntrophorhabdaceae bacterium PtaU1.Bin034]
MIDRILETKRQEVTELRKRRPPGRKKATITPLVFDSPVNIIAELKRKSPSAGFIRDVDPERIHIYSKYAKAISVLTDTTYFGGSYEFLTEVAEQTSLPVLCKDFIIDPVQVDFAYGAGADIVLLIARILDKEELEALYAHARRLGLSCVVELHDREEMAKLADIRPEIIGVNARNLDTMEVDLKRTASMLPDLHSPLRIAESGIKSRQDVERLIAMGANGFLIGETLMRSANPEAVFQELCR